MPSEPLAEHGDNHRWYAEMQEWFHSHGINIDTQPPFQYSLDCPHLNITKGEKNEVIWTGIITSDSGRT